MSRDVALGIVEYVRGELAAGRLSMGARIPSRAALMGRFGCARATVDRAIRLLEQDGVVRSEHGRGTFVRGAAGAGVASSALIVIPDMKELTPDEQYTYPLFLGLLQGLDGVRYEVWDVRRLAELGAGSKAARSLKRDKRVVYWVRPRSASRPLIESLTRAGVSVCCVHRDYAPAHVVDTDNLGGVAAGVEHLVAHGHRALGFVGGEFGREARHTEQRQLGFLSGLQRHGAQTRDAWILNTDSASELRESFARIYSDRERPSGWILLGTKYVAVLAAVAKDLGLAIPADISIVAFDDPGPVLGDGRTVTHLVQQLKEVGRQAAVLFDALAAGPEKRRVIKVCPRLVEGDTVSRQP